ncbi:hypothetical protein UlMin_023679 [Ulmus minor]
MGVWSNKIEGDQLKAGDHIYSWRRGWLYAHHGIYIGEGKVIHFTRGADPKKIGTGTVLDRFRFRFRSSPSTSLDNPGPRCGVISSCLDCFLSGGDLYLFKYGVNLAFFIAKARGGTCTLAFSDPNQDVLHRAYYLLEKGFGAYDLFKNNCEDFAIYCKTGLIAHTISVGRSGQVASFSAATKAIFSSPRRFLTTSFSGLTAAGCGMTRFSGLTAVGCMYCLGRLLSDMAMRPDVTKVPVERLVACSGIEHEVGPSKTDKKD